MFLVLTDTSSSRVYFLRDQDTTSANYCPLLSSFRASALFRRVCPALALSGLYGSHGARFTIGPRSGPTPLADRWFQRSRTPLKDRGGSKEFLFRPASLSCIHHPLPTISNMKRADKCRKDL
ncbi:hypothetical protein OIU74_020003 [Salix koriyanagi]|uniref:Uncharacterized protein n=1 Tax=Salix koriyanagi TaxID=2511006 RepID=A0A9Q0P4T7_9ROSI|nr:hypothetical protein OIU74_020003 [Salix koriyanagi]